MLTSILLLAAGIGVLYLGAEGLIRGAARMGVAWGIAPILVGLTVVSIGTSAPELVVSLLAASRGSPDLALGNILGSNLANVGLILGLAALARPLEVVPSVVRRDLPWMVVVTLLTFPLILNLRVGRVEGTVLALLLFAYLAILYRSWQSEVAAAPPPPRDPSFRPALEAGKVVLGALGLVAGGHLIVVGATDLAARVGVPELLVGLSVVAVGTSLPELATTVMAAIRREAGVALGNVLGSNMFNLLAIIGVAGLFGTIPIPAEMLVRDLWVMVGASALLGWFVLTGRSIGRVWGVVLLLLYAAYLAVLALYGGVT